MGTTRRGGTLTLASVSRASISLTSAGQGRHWAVRGASSRVSVMLGILAQVLRSGELLFNA